MGRLFRPFPLLLLGLFLCACGQNAKTAGSGAPWDIGTRGTLECLLFCHDAHAVGATSQVDAWAEGFHVAPSWGSSLSPTDASGAACFPCHDPRSNYRWRGDDPLESSFREQERAFLFTPGSRLGLPRRPFIGCEACHGSGTGHYLHDLSAPALTWSYSGGGNIASTFRPSTAYTPGNTFSNRYTGVPCACHAPSMHAGSLTPGVAGRLAAQEAEWSGGDGPAWTSRDGHSDSFVVRTLQGRMTSAKPAGPCVSCHTVEGFIRSQVNGEALAQTTIERLVMETGATGLIAPLRIPGPGALPQVSCVSCHPSHQGRTLLRGVGADPAAASTPARLCFACHNMEGVSARVLPGQAGSIPYHPQREMFLGTGGWRFSGFAWSATPSRHAFGHPGYALTLRAGCVACHHRAVADAPLAAYPNRVTTGHRFAARVDACTAACHPKEGGDPLLVLVDPAGSPETAAYAFTAPGAYPFSGARAAFRGEPLRTEVTGLLASLKSRLEARGGVWDNPRQMFDLPAMAGMSSTLRGAAWNYDFVAQDRSLGFHNPVYTRNLLVTSLSALP